MAITTRYINETLVYDTDWWSECCPYGHALKEAPSQSGKCPKNLYLIAEKQDHITRKVCCPLCEEFYNSHPLAHKSLNKAVTALKQRQITNHLLGA